MWGQWGHGLKPVAIVTLGPSGRLRFLGATATDWVAGMERGLGDEWARAEIPVLRFRELFYECSLENGRNRSSLNGMLRGGFYDRG